MIDKIRTKKIILEYLNEGKKAVSQIALSIHSNYKKTLEILKELEKENKVIKELNDTGSFTYYSLK